MQRNGALAPGWSTWQAASGPGTLEALDSEAVCMVGCPETMDPGSPAPQESFRWAAKEQGRQSGRKNSKFLP